MAARYVIPQQRRRFIHVHHQNVYVTVVIEVAEGATTARMRCGDSWAGLIDQLLELPVTKVAKDHARRTKWIRREQTFHFRIDAAGHKKKVRIAVIVQIDDPCPPSDEACLDAQSAAYGQVFKGGLAVVAIEDMGVVGEVSLEDIQVAIQIEVADAETHAGLLGAIF